MANVLERLDSQLGAFFSDWDLNTTLLAVLIVTVLLWPVIFPVEPDTHPLLLARQTVVTPVRNKFQSAVYRSPEVHPGEPLKSGLDLRDASLPRWKSGLDGDVRDIWREVQKGGTVSQAVDRSGTAKEVTIPKGIIMTNHGNYATVEHEVEQMSKEIQIIGHYLKLNKVKRVAIYLPNNLEYLLTIFACSFYGVSPVLLPYNVPHPAAYALIKATGADAMVCAAGSLPLDDIAKECSNVRLLTWVVETSSRHMDWNGGPSSGKKTLAVHVWHSLVEEAQAKATTELPSNETGDAPPDILTFWDSPTQPQVVSFSQGNIIAATAALISALPQRQRFSPADMVLAATSFYHPYALCQTFAALYTHASLAITSVAEKGVDLALATRGLSPTVIIASVETLAAYDFVRRSAGTSAVAEMAKYSYNRSLAGGRLPSSDGLMFSLLAPSGLADKGTKPGRLRLILTPARLDRDAPKLTSAQLGHLRVLTASRIVYALTVPSVAGAVAQTHVFDYRIKPGKAQNFGIPLSSVEVWLENKTDDAKVGGTTPEGQVVVGGPAVSGYNKSTGTGSVNLGVQGHFEQDGTLSLA